MDAFDPFFDECTVLVTSIKMNHGHSLGVIGKITRGQPASLLITGGDHEHAIRMDAAQAEAWLDVGGGMTVVTEPGSSATIQAHTHEVQVGC